MVTSTRISVLLSLIFKFGVLALAFLTPLFFWSYTTEFYETPKYLLLIIATSLFILLWITKWVVSGKITFTVSKLDLPFLLLLLAFILSMFFAASRSVAIFGNLPRLHGGLATYALYIVFYFVLAANLKKVATIKEVIYALLCSSIILAIMSILSYAGINLLSLPWTAAANFTPTGSTFSTAAILILMLPFPVSAILYGSKISSFDTPSQSEELDLPIASLMGSNTSLNQISVKIIWSVILGLFAVVLVLIGTMPVYIAAIIVLCLFLFVTPPNLIAKNSTYLFTPILIAILVAFISFVPIGGSKNVFYNTAANFPRELQLPFDTSWKISVSAFRDSPFWGTGPASYLGDFTLYKPIEFSSTPLWNVRFDTAFNEYLQMLATLGAIGLIVLLLLTVTAVAAAFKTLSNTHTGSIRLPLAIAAIAFFVILAIHASTLTIWVIGLLIIVSFLAVSRQSKEEVNIGIGVPQAQSRDTAEAIDHLPLNKFKFDIYVGVLSFVALVLITGIGLFLFQVSQAVTADFHHRQALKADAAGNILTSYNELILAEKFNPNVDLYRKNSAQTNFVMANIIAKAKGPSESSPAGSLTDEDKADIQTLLKQSVDEGQAAAALNPNDPGNWEVLGSIYQQLSGVAQNALEYALDSYGKAIQRDPLNPVLRLTVGRVYLSVNSPDLAIRFFTDAINIKSDYTNAYFNLAVAYDQRGDVQSAILAAEKTVSLLDKNSEDYKTATSLLNQLKDKAASESAKTQTQNANNQFAPQPDKNLPKVSDLPKPEKVATPEAIKKTPTPTPI